MARGKGRLREDDDDPEEAPQLPPSAQVAPVEHIEELDEEEQAQRDLDDLLGELEPVAASDESEGEDIFDDELLEKYVDPWISTRECQPFAQENPVLAPLYELIAPILLLKYGFEGAN